MSKEITKPRKKEVILTVRRLYAVVGVGIILGIGLALARQRYHLQIEAPFWMVLLLFAPAIYLQVIIHELGHFILGSIAGYRLWSFRIFGFVLKRVNGSFSYPPKP